MREKTLIAIFTPAFLGEEATDSPLVGRIRSDLFVFDDLDVMTKSALVLPLAMSGPLIIPTRPLDNVAMSVSALVSPLA